MFQILIHPDFRGDRFIESELEKCLTWLKNKGKTRMQEERIIYFSKFVFIH